MNRKTGNSRSSARVMATRRAVLCALALAVVAGAAGGLANSPTAILDVAALGDVDDMPASLEKVKFVKLYRAQKSSPNRNPMCLERIEVKHVDGTSLERANGVKVEASSSHAQPCEENGNNYGGCQQKTTNGKVCAMWNDRPGATEAAFRRRLLGGGAPSSSPDPPPPPPTASDYRNSMSRSSSWGTWSRAHPNHNFCRSWTDLDRDAGVKWCRYGSGSNWETCSSLEDTYDPGPEVLVNGEDGSMNGRGSADEDLGYSYFCLKGGSKDEWIEIELKDPVAVADIRSIDVTSFKGFKGPSGQTLTSAQNTFHGSQTLTSPDAFMNSQNEISVYLLDKDRVQVSRSYAGDSRDGVITFRSGTKDYEVDAVRDGDYFKPLCVDWIELRPHRSRLPSSAKLVAYDDAGQRLATGRATSGPLRVNVRAGGSCALVSKIEVTSDRDNYLFDGATIVAATSARTMFDTTLRGDQGRYEFEFPIDCVGQFEDVRVDGGTGEWAWGSDCSAQCGYGVQEKRYKVLTKARNGGAKCKPHGREIEYDRVTCVEADAADDARTGTCFCDLDGEATSDSDPCFWEATFCAPETITCDPPVVVIGAQATRIASRAFDFRISVTHPLCGQKESNECFSETPNGRIRCDVNMSRIGHDCSGGYAENFLPCRTWNDFMPKKVGLVYQGTEEYGEHQFEYKCYVVEYPGRASDPAIEEAVYSSTRVFNRTEGCDTLMPISADDVNDPNGELAKLLLLGSHSFTFNNAECKPHKIQDVKESIFRRYDTDPQDGVLTYNELVAARQLQNADADILTAWEEIESAKEVRDSLRLTLGEVMQSTVMPISCPQPNTQPIEFKTATQPIWEDKAKCNEDSRNGMTVTWKYGVDTTTKMNAGDFVCVYVDGILYEQAPAFGTPLPTDTDTSRYANVKNSIWAPIKIEDKRPVSGDFAGAQESLVAQFTFDNTPGDSSVDSVLLPVPGQTRVPTVAFSTGSAGVRTDCDETLGRNGVEYRGCQIVNRDGKICRRWDDLDDVGATASFYHAPGEEYDAGAHNYCRTSTRNGAETIWCYNEDNTGWAYCDPVEQAPPEDGDVRLVGGANKYTGRVEVYSARHNTWGTVCDDNFDDNDAKVVCRQLRYGYDKTAGADWSYSAGSKWGVWLPGTGAILLDDVGCSGHESRIFDCTRAYYGGYMANNVGSHNCGHYEDTLVKCTPPPPSTTDTEEERRYIDACVQGEGKKCFQPTPEVQGLKYIGDAFVDSMAFTTWIYIPGNRVRCPDSRKSYPNDNRRNFIFSLEGESAGETYRLQLELDDMKKYCRRSGTTKVQLSLRYGEPSATSGSMSWTSMPNPITLYQGKWYLIGFALDPSDGMKMFAYEKGVSRSASMMQNMQDWPKGTLMRMPTVRMFETIGMQYDDARLFTGKLSQGTIESMHTCGRPTFCSERARATPSSRRVVCAFADLEANIGQKDVYACTAGVYFDGAAIDFTATMGMGGVTFSFRDTSGEENAFEITRVVANAVDSLTPDTVVMVQGELLSCGSVFSSITYMDLEAGVKPNLDWRYYVVTKTATGESFSSLPFRFTSPWLSEVEGNVYAGTTTNPVPGVRICAEFKSVIESQLALQSDSLDIPTVPQVSVLSTSGANSSCTSSTNATDGTNATVCANVTTTANGTNAVTAIGTGTQQPARVNVAKFKRARHSDFERSANSYVLTDGKIQKSAQKVLINENEYVRVDLGRWSSIETIEVCVDGLAPSLSVPPRAFVQDYDPEGTGNHGHECKHFARDEVALYACEEYVCAGASLTSFHGQFVTIAGVNATNVTEIRALGKETRCTYSAITDKDGQFDIQIKDRSGVIAIKTEMHVGAYKEEVFPETTEILLDSMFEDASADEYRIFEEVPKSQPLAVLLVLRDVGGSNSSASAAVNANATSEEATGALATPQGASRKLLNWWGNYLYLEAGPNSYSGRLKQYDW